jgi:hypothetical protein
LLALLLALALWQRPIRGRIFWLALVGGLAVGHHRALIMTAPALIVAVWPELTASRRPLVTVGLCLLIGLLGLVPYAYLPLREWAGAGWVYGEPGTLDGLWAQFSGREAERFIGLPDTWDALIANFIRVNEVIYIDFSTIPALAGLIGLLAALFTRHRRAALVFLLNGVAAYLFHIFFYTDVLSALILPVTLSLVFGWLLALDALYTVEPGRLYRRGFDSYLAVVILGLVMAWLLVRGNAPFVASLTRDPTGLQTIDDLRRAPPDSALMLAWGPRHFAAGFARDVLGERRDVLLVDHKADFAALARERLLVTPAYTFYNQPLDWWQARLGETVYLNAAAPGLVALRTTANIQASGGKLRRLEEILTCTDESFILDVTWYTPDTPDRDLSVFVHLLDRNGALLAQADQSAPVYGWRPLKSWVAGEAVHDIYTLPRQPGGSLIRYGLYRQTENGEFENVLVYSLAATCEH